MIKVLYFAWVRERIGVSSEMIEPQGTTAKDLLDQLCAKGERYELALSDLASLRIAIDQELVDFDSPLGNAKEIALFPPMTGG